MDVSKAMRSARDESGNRLFTSTEFLTPKQVASFFSRVAASKNTEATDETESEELAVEEERLIHSIRNQVEKEVVLCHPITYDVHNICELVAQGKLSVFSVKMLQDMCVHLGEDISDICVKRKKPYIDRVVGIVKQCTCNSAP